MAGDLIGIAFTIISLSITVFYFYYVFFGAIDFLKNVPAPTILPGRASR